MALKYSGDYYKTPDLHIDKYLEEKKKEIFEQIEEHDRLLLVAPTGSGKSHFIISNTDELLKTYDKIIFVVPLLPLQAEFDVKWSTDLSINHEQKSISVDDYDEAKRITTTYRSLYKISKYLESDTLIIFDEFHTVFNDNLAKLDKDNINRNIKAIEQSLVSSARIIALTATPQVFISKSLGFSSFIVGYNTPPYIRNISIKEIPMLPSYMLARINYAKKNLEKGKKLFVYYKKIDALEYFFKAFDKKVNFLDNNSVITGEKLRNNELGFVEYINNVFEKFNLIFSTNAITTGLSIKNENISKILIFDTTESDEIVQLMSRFREVKEVDVEIYLSNKFKRSNFRFVFSRNELDEIKIFSKQIRTRKKSDFNYGILANISKKQKGLQNLRYKTIDKEQLKKELARFDGFGIKLELIRADKFKIILNDSDARNKFFNKSDKFLRASLAFDLAVGSKTIDFSVYDFLKIFESEVAEHQNYYESIRAFSDAKFKNTSDKYFNLGAIMDDSADRLLNNWHLLTSANLSNLEAGMIANHIFVKYIKINVVPNKSTVQSWITKNYYIINKIFKIALNFERFKHVTLEDEDLENIHILHIDNETKIKLIPKLIVSIARSMFNVETKGKGRKSKDGEYFHYFQQPDFSKANPTADIELVYVKEGDNDVLYVYKLDITDKLVLQKHLSKVLVSDGDLIKNILNK